MRLALATLAGLAFAPLLAASPPAAAQSSPMPPGDYRQHCSRLYMEGQILHGYCQGPRGAGESSINVLSCSTGIFVDASGALTCIGPGGAPPPAAAPPPGGHARNTAELYSRAGWSGRSMVVRGPTPNLAGTGMNDRVRSIRLDPRSGPWLVCTDARFAGRCVTIRRSVADTAELKMRDDISSLRPLS